ncbi:hypothetical protein NDA14_002685 [Ustilago hordei]|nr:hypothetical protein NDA14_002685 [Ustilago hordei]
MSSVAGSDDARASSLASFFRRLRLRSPTPAPHHHHEPEPLPLLPPKQPQRQAYGQSPSVAAESLPPYLAHLARARSTLYRPGPSFPQPQHHHVQGEQSPSKPHRCPSSRPIAGPSRASKPHYRASDQSFRIAVPQAHPSSLTPGPVRTASGNRPSYPWELVPQAKAQPPSNTKACNDPGGGQELGKENRPPQRRDPFVAVGNAHASDSNVTPPRRREKDHAQTTKSDRVLTPNGSQKHPGCSPSPGQCWGIKKDGTRCTRKVRTPANSVTSHSPCHARVGSDRGASVPANLSTRGRTAAVPLVVVDSDDDDGSIASPSRSKARATSASAGRCSQETILLAEHNVDQVYCYQHVAEVNKHAGIYSSLISGTTSNSTSPYIQFSDWFDTVPLSEHTEALLRLCMARHLSKVDRNERGYIYIYELRDRSTDTHLCLKVGRTSNVFRRIGEWRSRCQSKDPLLLSYHPSTEQQGLISGASSVKVDGVRFSHRWEALVHVELAGIGERVDEVCDDCSVRHREIFMVPRSTSNNEASRQYDAFDLTQRIVNKWMQFVKTLA